MKKNHVALCVSIAVITCFFSCQKNINDLPPTPAIKDDSMSLVKFVRIDTASANRDTLEVYSFTYDDRKRNTGIEVIEYGLDGKPYSQPLYTAQFTYNGTDTLPASKIVNSYDKELYGNIPDYTEHGFYKYSNGKLVYDSISHIYINNSLYHDLYRSRTFDYSQGSIMVTRYDYDYSGGAGVPNPYFHVNYDTIQITSLNGNIVGETDLYEQYAFTKNYTISYDNHPNPLFRTCSRLLFAGLFPYFEEDNPIDVTESNQVNNQTSSRYYELLPDGSPGTTNYNNSFTYEYLPNGWPSKVINNGTGLWSFSEVGYFIYTKK